MCVRLCVRLCVCVYAHLCVCGMCMCLYSCSFFLYLSFSLPLRVSARGRACPIIRPINPYKKPSTRKTNQLTDQTDTLEKKNGSSDETCQLSTCIRESSTHKNRPTKKAPLTHTKDPCTHKRDLLTRKRDQWTHKRDLSEDPIARKRKGKEDPILRRWVCFVCWWVLLVCNWSFFTCHGFVLCVNGFFACFDGSYFMCG